MKHTESPRQFGLTIAAALSMMGALLLWRGRGFHPYFFVFSFIFLCFGVFWPYFLKPAQKIAQGFVLFLGKLATNLVLIILLYLILTPLSLACKIFGKRFLDLGFGQNKKTAWVLRDQGVFDKKRCEMQF